MNGFSFICKQKSLQGYFYIKIHQDILYMILVPAINIDLICTKDFYIRMSRKCTRFIQKQILWHSVTRLRSSLFYNPLTQYIDAYNTWQWTCYENNTNISKWNFTENQSKNTSNCWGCCLATLYVDFRLIGLADKGL